MKILYCNKYSYPFSGTEVYLFELMQMMREHGHEVALFSMADRRAESPDAKYFVPHIDFKNNQDGLFKRIRLAAHAVYSFEARRKLARMIEEFRPDMAHIRNIYHHLTPSILWELKRHRVPVLYHLNDFKLLCPSYNLVSHGSVCERCHGGQFWNVVPEGCYFGGLQASMVLAAEAYLHRWLQTYESCVDRFLAPSEFVRNKLMEAGWDGGKISVLAHFQKLPEGGFTAPQATAPVLYFGRLSAEKGIMDLLQAMERLPGIRLQIAGEGPEREKLEDLAKRKGLSNVEFLGKLRSNDLERVIARSSFTVLPSHAYETLGKTILESYAQGRAVIASDLGSRREFVKHGETGLLYPVGDVTRLAMAISFLYERPELAAILGEAGRRFVRERHNPASYYESIVSLYRELSAARGVSGAELRRSAIPAKPRLRIAFMGGRGIIGKYSGIEGHYEEVGRRLAAAGHEVTVYCRSYFTPDCANHQGMKIVRLPSLRSKHLDTPLHTLESTLHAVFRPYDIVHYHALGPALFSAIPRLIGKKTVVTVQGLDWQRKKWGALASLILRLGEKAAICCPDTTIVVSQSLHSYFRNRYGAETEYIANGAILRERVAPRRILNWQLEPDEYILFLGRFSPEKNCHLLIEAYERLNTSVKLVLAGGSSSTDNYAQELKLHANAFVRLLDYVSGDAFEELLTNAALFVLPSDLEGLSLALLEAMGAGVCVLASDIPENRELVRGAGFLFKPGDVADLERMLRLLLSNPHLRMVTGKAAKRRIQEEYQWSRIAAQVEEVYLRLTGWRSQKLGPVLNPSTSAEKIRSFATSTSITEKEHAA